MNNEYTSNNCINMTQYINKYKTCPRKRIICNTNSINYLVCFICARKVPDDAQRFRLHAGGAGKCSQLCCDHIV